MCSAARRVRLRPGHGDAVSTPLYSNTTLVVFFPTLAFGGTVVLMPKFDAAALARAGRRHRVTHAMLVPVQYQRLMARPDFDRHDLSALPHEVLHQRTFPPRSRPRC
jgi:acyl-CoA synthetase (AMP-forming)/AMP-acid ligase II